MDILDLYDWNYLKAHHLRGKDCPVKIEEVYADKVSNEDGEKRIPFLKFEGKDLPLGLSKDNTSILIALFGTHEIEKWKGKSITLFPTQRKIFGKMQDVISIRPDLPKAAK